MFYAEDCTHILAHTFLMRRRSLKQILLTCVCLLAVGRESEAEHDAIESTQFG